MFRFVLLMSAVVLSTTTAVVIVQPVAHYVQPQLQSDLTHPAVIANGNWEHQLHPSLIKSDKFYSNPRTAAHLAQESWLADKEMPVFARKAEEIDRRQIGKIFHDAGFNKRR